MQLAHHAGSNIDKPGQVLWHQRYQYALDSNRLLATSLPGDPDNLPDYAEVGGYTAKYSLRRARQHHAHDAPAADALGFQRPAAAPARGRWGTTARPRPPTTSMAPTASGHARSPRRQNGARKNERLYLGGYEIYREYSGGEHRPWSARRCT